MPGLTGGNTPGVDDGFIKLGGTELVLSTNVTIDGDVDGDGDADITVSGDDASRVFKVDDGGISQHRRHAQRSRHSRRRRRPWRRHRRWPPTKS